MSELSLDHPPSVFVWSKLCDIKWKDSWEERLDGLADTVLIITVLPDEKTLRLEVYAEHEENARAVQKEWGGRVREMKSKQWIAECLEPRPPIIVRDKLIVTNSTDPLVTEDLRRVYPGRPVLQIPAEMAFGTGEHATTGCCLRILADLAPELAKQHPAGWDLLDLGCGTGILAFAAKIFGAAGVVGCDLDPHAIRTARENAQRNALPEVTFWEQDVLEWKPKRRWPVIAANIYSGLLIKALPVVREAAEPKATVIFSGVLRYQLDEVLEALKAQNFTVERVYKPGKWTAILTTKEVEERSGQALPRTCV